MAFLIALSIISRNSMSSTVSTLVPPRAGSREQCVTMDKVEPLLLVLQVMGIQWEIMEGVGVATDMLEDWKVIKDSKSAGQFFG